MTGDEGKEVTGSAQYCAVNKSPCGKASMTGYRFSAVLCCKEISLWKGQHEVMRETRLQVWYSAVVWKEFMKASPA